MIPKNDDELYILDTAPTIDEYNQTNLYLLDLFEMRRTGKTKNNQKIEQTELI